MVKSSNAIDEFLKAEHPSDIIIRGPEQKGFLHGNPCRFERGADEYTPVTIVKDDNVTEEILKAVKKKEGIKASEPARREL